MATFVLVLEDQRISLPVGETLVGRALGCHLRFNDPAVSREHLLIQVADDHAVATSLSESNGTLLNGTPLVGSQPLRQGDELRLGFRKLFVEISAHARNGGDAGEVEVEWTRPEGTPGYRVLVDEAWLAEETTRPGEEGWRQRAVASDLAPLQPIVASRLSEIRIDLCPRCKQEATATDRRCS